MSHETEEITKGDRVIVELMNIHEMYSSEFLKNNYLQSFKENPRKSLRENVTDYINSFEADNTKELTDAGYWILGGYESWKARELASIAGDYADMNEDEVLEIFETESN